MTTVSETLGDEFQATHRAACSGNGDAFERLYGLLSRRLHAYVRMRGVRDPEGMVNEIFLLVFRGLGNFTGSESQFKAWVFRIARNKVIDDARHQERRPTEVFIEDGLTAEWEAPDDVEGEAVAAAHLAELVETLQVLTDEQRDVLLLRTVGDLTVEMVAETIGKHPGAVKALQRRALRTLARTAEQASRTLAQPCHVPGC